MTHRDKAPAFGTQWAAGLCSQAVWDSEDGACGVPPVAPEALPAEVSGLRLHAGGPLSLCWCLCCGSVAPHLPPRCYIRPHGKPRYHPGFSGMSPCA